MGNKQSFLLHMTAVLALLTLLTLSPVNGEIVMFTANTPSALSDVDSNDNVGSSTNPVSYTSTVNGQNQILTEQEESINTENWPYYKNIYINSSNIDSQLANFPLLLDIKDADLKTYAQADGDDIAFFDETGTQAPHEIQTYDSSFNSTHAALLAWVRVPTVYASIDTRLEMRYGNSTMTNQEDSANTWSTFNNVWHLEEDPSGVAPQTTDELGNNHGTSAGSMTSSDLISGPIGSGIDFDGVDDSINIGDLSTTAWAEFSVSLWFNQSVDGDDRIFGYAVSGNTDSSIFSVLVGNAGAGSITVRVGTDGVGGTVSSSISSTNAFTLNTWNHVSLSWSASTETIRVVLNGQLLRTQFKDGDTLRDLAATAAIGNANGIGTDRYLTGQIDDVRISIDDRSDAWFKAEYTNQNNPGIFFSMTTSKSFDVFDAVDTVSQGTPLSEIGSQSNYADMRAVDGQMNTLTELQRPLNNRSLISNGAGSMRIGGGTEDWRRTSGTISFWVQWVGAPTGTQRPWGQGQDFEARVGPIDATVFRMTLDWGGDNSLVSQYNLTAGQWYFFGITWDQAIDDLYLYIGSESTFPLSTESNTAWTSDITLDPLLVNEFLSSRGSGNYVNGRGDELTFFDKALTQSELDYVHDHVLSGSEDNLISLFTFDGLNQDSNLMDIGPAGADGTQFGTLSYSTSEPDPPNTDYVYFNEFQFNNVPYTRTVGTLAIKTGNFGAEALGVDYWTGTSWSTLSNNLVANSWNNFSLSSELSSSTFTIRLIDETRNLDTTPNTWEIDAVILDYENYRLDMEHSITGVDRDREYYDLTIYGQSSSASENYGASIWTGASWTSDLVTITSTLAWYNNSITGHEYSTTMYIKYQDLNTARDNLQNSLNLDYVGINSYDIDPVITSSPGNLVYVEGTTSNIATWQFTDDSPNNYNIYVDDVAQGLTAYSSPATVNFNIDGLERGTHNITIEIFDDYTGYTVDQITVTVNDETNPTIDSPSDFVMVEQIIGNALNWSANDLHPDTYTIYRNGSSIDTGSWLNGQNISISLNGLAKGTWNYTVEARDDSNNPITDTIFVTVNDETPPDIDPTSNVNYDEDSTGNYLSWTANDFYPDNYVLYQNGSQINASTWISGNPIRQNIDGLVVGDYNYTIVIFDASNNYAINTIWVFSRDTTPPSVSGPGTIAYEQGSSGNSITWTLSDTNPPMNVIVYKNGSQLFSTPMPNGQFVLGIDGLGLGTYNYTIHVTDFYGNSNVDTVIVTVNDTIIPVITSPAANTTMSEGSSGNSLTWIVTDNNPDTFTVYNNGTGEAPAPWFSGVDTEYDLDSLTKGTYNITITFVDDAGNEISYTVWVTVLDQTSPTITRPANIQYEYGVTPNTITWTATDTYAATYIIYKDGVSHASGSWTSGEGIAQSVDGLGVGFYNYTIFVVDASGNSVTDTVIVTVVDTTNPIVSDTTAIQYFEDETPKSMQWTATDGNPATYSLYQDGIVVASGSWSNGVPIVYNFNSLPKGTYNFTIIVVDTSGNSATDYVPVQIDDRIAPSVDQPVNGTYAEGTTSNSIAWVVSDTNPGTQIIYRNGVPVQVGSWTSGTSDINIDGLSLGLYNFTIFLNDTTGNSQTDTVWITVFDNTFPIFSSTPSNVTINEVSTGNKVTWVATDLHPDTYIIYRNGVPGTPISWGSGNSLNHATDDLTKGLYNITISLQDTSGNTIIHTVWVTVIDQTNPSVTSPADIQYEYNAGPYSITWTPTDAYAQNYTLLKDGVTVDANTWTTNVDIFIDVTGLDLGTYNYTLILEDESGNLKVDTVIVTIVDTTLPTTTTPNNFSYNEGDTANNITWTGTDLLPSSYIILKDSLQVSSGAWSSGVATNYNVDGLLLGVYNYTIVFNDTTGNERAHTVLVTVTDTNAPSITSPGNSQYSEGSTGNSIGWIVSDTHPDYVTVTRNGTLVLSDTWSAGTINILIDGLTYGLYEYVLTLNDTSGNSNTDTIYVTVVDDTLPILSQPADAIVAEGTTGNSFYWVANDINEANYTIYLDGVVNQTGTWISGGNITVSVDGFAARGQAYNYTILLQDTSNNRVVDTLEITVTAASVFVSIPDDIDYVLGATGNTISWTVSDIDPNNYILYRDGVQINASSWASGVPIVENIDGLSIANYNFTILVNDTDGNLIVDTVFVNVSDMPVWSFNPTNITDYSEGSTGNHLNWTATDLAANLYTVYIDGTFYSSNTWTSGVNITVNIDGLTLGTYNFSIHLNDTSGNTITAWVLVTVIDTTFPVFTDTQIPITISEVSTNNFVSWTATDLHAGTYTLIREFELANTTVVTDGSWTTGIAIEYNIDSLTKGTYTFYILIQDGAGNTITHSVIITVEDQTIPSIDSSQVTGTTITEVSSGNWVNVTASDTYASTYEIWVNGVRNGTQAFAWTSGVSVDFNIDSLAKNTYNITFIFFDEDNNFDRIQFSIDVVDLTNPSVDLSQVTGTTITEISSPNWVNVTASDTYASTYEIWVNGVRNGSQAFTWTSGLSVDFNIDDLSKGIYNITFVFIDESLNRVTEQFSITVVDQTVPSIDGSSLTGTTITEVSSNNWVNVTASDTYAASYQIFVNSLTPTTSGSWTSGVPVNYNIDYLTKGTYNVTFLFIDASSNTNKVEFTITVNDQTLPSIDGSSVTATTITESSSNNWINVTASDAYASTYEIWVNGVRNGSQAFTWTSSLTVNFNIDYLTKGIYNVTFLFIDESSNTNKIEFTITVEDQTNPSIDGSSVTGNTISEASTNNWINVTASDTYAQTYEIYVNSLTPTTSGAWSSGVPVNYNIDSLTKGSYNITFLFIDESSNTNKVEFTITVEDQTIPSIDSSSVTGTTISEVSSNNWVNVTASDSYAQTYEIYVNSLTPTTSGVWTSGIAVNYNIDSLTKGTYNITFLFIDESSNTNKIEFSITVQDQTSPQFSGSSTSGTPISDLDSNTWINITVTDIYPSTYEVYENSLVANFSGSWSSGVSLNFNLEHLDKGVFNITFVFHDESGNIYTTQFSITVQDTTIPIISDSVSPPGDITEASSNNWINVTSTDKYASVYEIYVNSPSVTSTGAWTSGVSVDYNLDSLTRGLYNITFLFIDEDGNSERIQFLINVIDATNPEIQISLSPSVDITEVSIGNWINVTTTDNYADVYEIWVNGVLNGSKSFVWTSGISVDFNLDNLVKGTYNVTFVFIDESSNRVTTVYTITVIDITVPIVESVQTTSLNTNEGESGNWINVTASDSYAATYEIWVNGVRNGSQAYPWSSNVAVNLNIDYLTLGTYNVTFIFYDESGNSQRTQVDINVFDITLPDVSNTGDIPAYIEGSGSNWINWTATDNHADNYAIYRNNSLIDSGSWSSGTPINLDIDGLAKNYYVYTISVYDTTGNLRNSTVYVTVIDTTLPSISSDGDFSISEGATGEVVSWTGFDVNFDTYTIDIDGLFNTSGFWNNDDPVTYLLDGFLKGTYVFTLTLFDTSGNSFNTSISVDVLDTTNPVVDTLTTTTYEEGTTGNILTWTATDNYPATYSAKIDGVEVASGVWSSGIGIVVSIDGLLLGEYVVSITIIDVSGNQVSSGTIVRIFEITPPSFISDQYYNYTYVEGTSGHLLNWTVTDPYAGTYVYFRNNVQRGGGSWNSGTEVSINIDGLVKGVYNFTIYFRDTSLNTIRSTVLVTVIDTKVPAVSTTDSYLFRRGTAGNEVSWIATDLYPDIYAVYLNGSQIVTGASWSSGSPISVSGDALEIGIYNFTVVFFDRSGNSNSSTSIISMVDGVPAILISGANDLDFDEGSIGNTLTWMYSDPSPANYIILENGTQIDSQPWVANVSFSFVLDDLQKGVYNITLVVYDQAGNIATYTNIITVLDATLPTFVSQPVASFNYTEQETGFSLSWTMSDKYDGTYEILRNGTILQTGSWVTDDPRTISIDGLSYGHYNYTMVVWDASGNQILDTVLVSVFDETLPEILSEISPDLYYEGRTGYLLNWSVFDIHGFNYTVDVNGEVYATGSWNESQFIVIDIDGLAYGTYNFTITIMDESLNSATEWVEIDVLDDTFPDMTLSQEAVTFILDTTGNTISWTATDLNPGSFVVYLEGNIVYLTNTWVSNEPIVISVDGFNAGYYNFSIVIADQALNEIRDSVIVRIKDPTLVDTILPEFEIEQEVYEGDIEIINGTWVDIDGNPITNGEITISLFLQDKIRSRVVFTDDQGQYGLIFNYTGLLPGFYTWVVDFEAEGYESWTELERYAALLPHGLSIELFVDTDIVRGEEYFITAILKYNNRNDSTGLSLSELVGREGIAEGVEVEFFISILKLDGTTAFYSLSNFTNAEGVVKVFLTSAQTREADELLDIVATIISTDGFQSSSSSLPEEDKPVVRPPPPTVIEQALQFIQDNSFLILLVSVGIVFILAFAVILQKRRQDRIMELNTAIKLSYDEVRALESMKAIIIQTKSKLTIYEELVNEEGMNTNLVGGMVTAFSSFLNELGQSGRGQFGFETMERGDVSLTVHKGVESNFIVISSMKLPFVLMGQIQKAQETLEEVYSGNFTNTSRGVKKLTRDQVHPQLINSAFKIDLLNRLELRLGGLKAVHRERAISRAIKQYIDLLKELPGSRYTDEDGTFRLRDLVDFFSSRDINRRMSSRIVMAAYQFGVIVPIDAEEMEE